MGLHCPLWKRSRKALISYLSPANSVCLSYNYLVRQALETKHFVHSSLELPKCHHQEWQLLLGGGRWSSELLSWTQEHTNPLTLEAATICSKENYKSKTNKLQTLAKTTKKKNAVKGWQDYKAPISAWEKNHIQETRGAESKPFMLSLVHRAKITGTHHRVWRTRPVGQKEWNSAFKAQEAVDRSSTPAFLRAAFPLILNHLLWNRWHSSHWPRQSLDCTHGGINPTGSETNEGDGFLHELVTNRIKPVK